MKNIKEKNILNSKIYNFIFNNTRVNGDIFELQRKQRFIQQDDF